MGVFHNLNEIDKMNVHFSAQTCIWATPDGLFKDLNNEFCFTLDVCCNHKNAKCDNFFTTDDDGLLQNWKGVVWCNPPYGNKIGDWCRKAQIETSNGVTTVMLLPARTDTRWFHEYILGKAEVRFIKGRLRFGDAKFNAPFPSMIIVYKSKT